MALLTAVMAQEIPTNIPLNFIKKVRSQASFRIPIFSLKNLSNRNHVKNNFWGVGVIFRCVIEIVWKTSSASVGLYGAGVYGTIFAIASRWGLKDSREQSVFEPFFKIQDIFYFRLMYFVI